MNHFVNERGIDFEGSPVQGGWCERDFVCIMAFRLAPSPTIRCKKSVRVSESGEIQNTPRQLIFKKNLVKILIRSVECIELVFCWGWWRNFSFCHWQRFLFSTLQKLLRRYVKASSFTPLKSNSLRLYNEAFYPEIRMKDFDTWNTLKKDVDARTVNFYVLEREIRYAHL